MREAPALLKCSTLAHAGVSRRARATSSLSTLVEESRSREVENELPVDTTTPCYRTWAPHDPRPYHLRAIFDALCLWRVLDHAIALPWRIGTAGFLRDHISPPGHCRSRS